MEAEQLEISHFISMQKPFSELPEEWIKTIAMNIEVAYFREGTQILKLGEDTHDIYMVKSGAVEVYRRNGELFNRIDSGGIFGQLGFMMGNTVRMPVHAIEDALIYCIPDHVIKQLYDEFDSIAELMELEESAQLRNAISARANKNDLTKAKIKTILNTKTILIKETESISEAAKLIARENVSALLVTKANELNSEECALDDENEDDSLIGIVTERDFCIRVIAEDLDVNLPVSEIMTKETISLDYNAYIYEAMFRMLSYNVQHLPILKEGKPFGVMNMADILRYESQNSLLIVNSIFQKQNIKELVAVSKQVSDCFVRLVNEDANSHMIGRALSVIGSSFKQRLAELAEQKLGPPPIPYCFVAMGSMARDEQLIVTDQDNALILDNSYNEAEHGEYFTQLATFICTGLAKCGYRYCKGEIMATNSLWRKTRAEWEACFANWIDQPTPERLLNSSIFFDFKGVYGRVKWAEQLRNFFTHRARKNNRFLAAMAYNAIRRTPPLGFFKEFVLEKDGEQKKFMNLKSRGTAPLADMIRVYALSIGSTAQNSFERLNAIIDAKILPKGRGEDLLDAMELIYMVRIRHQALNIEAGIKPNNKIYPDKMSDFERRNLKAAFHILNNAQNFIKYRYQRS